MKKLDEVHEILLIDVNYPNMLVVLVKTTNDPNCFLKQHEINDLKLKVKAVKYLLIDTDNRELLTCSANEDTFKNVSDFAKYSGNFPTSVGDPNGEETPDSTDKVDIHSLFLLNLTKNALPGFTTT